MLYCVAVPPISVSMLYCTVLLFHQIYLCDRVILYCVVVPPNKCKGVVLYHTYERVILYRVAQPLVNMSV